MTATIAVEAAAAQVLELLTDLGNTPDGVAAEPRAAGAHGCRWGAKTCPIYHYLVQRCPGITIVHVDGIAVDIEIGGRYDEVCVTEPVSEFITRFDNGTAYQDLAVSQ